MIKLPQTLPEKTLLVRVEELQASIAHRILAAYRTGVRKAPPADLVGARHVVMVKETPDGLCEFEEGLGQRATWARWRGRRMYLRQVFAGRLL